MLVKMEYEGRELIELSGKEIECGKYFFQEKVSHKPEWVSGVDGRKSLLDLTVLQEEEKKLVDVNAFRDGGGEISNHYLGETKTRCLMRWL